MMKLDEYKREKKKFTHERVDWRVNDKAIRVDNFKIKLKHMRKINQSRDYLSVLNGRW